MTVDSLVACRHCQGYPQITRVKHKAWTMQCDCLTVFEESAAGVLVVWRERHEGIQIGVSDLTGGDSR